MITKSNRFFLFIFGYKNRFLSNYFEYVLKEIPHVRLSGIYVILTQTSIFNFYYHFSSKAKVCPLPEFIFLYLIDSYFSIKLKFNYTKDLHVKVYDLCCI